MKDRELGKALLNTHTGMLIRRAPRTSTRNSFTKYKDLRSHPLIKSCTITEEGMWIKRWEEYDYTYNYTIIQSLILSQAKANMERVCRFCATHEIPMFYSSCDSLYVKSADVEKLSGFRHETLLGKMKVEAKNQSGAMFLSQGLYYVSDDKYSAQWVPHTCVEKYCAVNGISIRGMFEQLRDGVVSLKQINQS